MCSLGSQWKRSAGLLGRISSSWSVEIVWMHCCSCFRHGLTLFTWEHTVLSITLWADPITLKQIQLVDKHWILQHYKQSSLSDWFCYLSSVQVVRDLKYQEEDPQRLLLDGISLPVFHNSPAQCEKRVHFAELSLHKQQLEDKKVTQHMKKFLRSLAWVLMYKTEKYFWHLLQWVTVHQSFTQVLTLEQQN